MPASPLCLVNATSTANGVNVATGSTVTITLSSATDVRIWSIRCLSTDETSSVEDVVLVVNQSTHTATFTAPAVNRKTYILESKVNNGLVVVNGVQVADPTLTTTFGVYVAGGDIERVIAKDETMESSSAAGWAATINPRLRDLDSAPEYTLANVRIYGHSNITGVGATRIGTTNGAARILHDLNSDYAGSTYIGRSGADTGQLLPLAAADVDAHKVVGKINIFVYWEIVNSVVHYMGSGGMSEPDATALIVSQHLQMCSDRKAAGWDKAIICTMYHSDTESADMALCTINVNQGLRNALGGGTIDGIVDLGTAPEFLMTTPPTLLPDQVHPNDAGHQIWSGYATRVIQQVFEGMSLDIPRHEYTPNAIGGIGPWYEARSEYVIRDGSNRISQLIDRSSWAFDAFATGSLRPTWTPSSSLWGGRPSIEADGSNCMTTSLDVDMVGYGKFEIVAAYRCTSNGTIVAEFSNSSSSFTDTWIARYHLTGNAHQITSYGNVGTSNAYVSSPSTPATISHLIDHTVTSRQCHILADGNAIAGEVYTDAPNTNTNLGTRKLSLFAREGGSSGSSMSLVFFAIFRKILTASDRAGLLAYIQFNWPRSA